MLGESWTLWIVKNIAGFLLIWLVFWLLSKLEDAGIIWGLVVIIGIPILLL